MPVASAGAGIFHPPRAFPYHTQGGRIWTWVSFDGHMTRALEKADAADFLMTWVKHAEAEGQTAGVRDGGHMRPVAFRWL